MDLYKKNGFFVMQNKKILVLLLLSLMFSRYGISADTDTQDVTITYSLINSVVITGTPSITVDESDLSAGTVSGSDATSSLAAFSNDGNAKKNYC